MARIFRDQMDQTSSQHRLEQGSQNQGHLGAWIPPGMETTPPFWVNWFQCLITLKVEKLLLTFKYYLLYCNQCLRFSSYNSNSVCYKMFLHTITQMNLAPCFFAREPTCIQLYKQNFFDGGSLIVLDLGVWCLTIPFKLLLWSENLPCVQSRREADDYCRFAKLSHSYYLLLYFYNRPIFSGLELIHPLKDQSAGKKTLYLTATNMRQRRHKLWWGGFLCSLWGGG